MRIFGLMLLVGVFLVTPMVLLNTMVMPQLQSLEYTYSHLDEVAAKAAR